MMSEGERTSWMLLGLVAIVAYVVLLWLGARSPSRQTPLATATIAGARRWPRRTMVTWIALGTALSGAALSLWAAMHYVPVIAVRDGADGKRVLVKGLAFGRPSGPIVRAPHDPELPQLWDADDPWLVNESSGPIELRELGYGRHAKPAPPIEMPSGGRTRIRGDRRIAHLGPDDEPSEVAYGSSIAGIEYEYRYWITWPRE